MKKLMVVLMVLSIATIANADLKIQVGGVDVTQIAAGTVSNISVVTTTNIVAGGAGEGYYILVANSLPTPPTNPVSGGVPLNTDCSFDLTGLATLGVPAPAGVDGAFMGIFNFGADYVAGTAIYTGITLNATGGTLDIYPILLTEDGSAYAGYGARMASVTITPEPMTMGLLGLGGLFLRRRNK